MDQGGKETSFSLLELRKTTGPRIAVFCLSIEPSLLHLFFEFL